MFWNTWTWDQWKAAGRHASSYAGGIITGAVALGLVSNVDGATLTSAIKEIMDGSGKVIAGLISLVGVVGPIYSAIKASRSAAPENQAKQTVKNIEEGVPLGVEGPKLVEAIVASPNISIPKGK